MLPSERSRLLQDPPTGAESLLNLFDQPPESTAPDPIGDSFRIPISGGEGEIKPVHQRWVPSFDTSSMGSTITGSIVFCVYHVVFCLAQAATITRPHATSSSTGALAKTAALGVLISGPVFIYGLGDQVPAIYPSSDLFLAPFLAQIAEVIDGVLAKKGLENDDDLFLTTFLVVTAGFGLILSGLLCVAAARIKLANLGLFLPYSVLAGFFTTIGILMWTLGFSVDTGMKMGVVARSNDWSIVSNALLHHLPSVLVGTAMHLAGRKHPYWVLFFMFATVFGSYLVLWAAGTTLEEATENKWFFSVEDLIPSTDYQALSWKTYKAPLPFGAWVSAGRGMVDWEAVVAAFPNMLALACLYLIRCSLHAAVLKKNIPLVTRQLENPPESPRQNGVSPAKVDGKKKEHISLNVILETGYAYSQLTSAFIGAITIAPSVAASLTLFQLGAEMPPPQYGSCLLMIPIYMTDFRIVKYIPKPAFSCLMVLAGIDMCRTWIIGSFYKVKDKAEWMVAPMLVVLAFSVGMLTAIFVGVAVSTFIFAANFYRTGTVKFVGTGLTLRSPVARAPRESSWLDKEADLIQILILQNYLFFGNAQSVFHYVATMFEEDDEDEIESAMKGHYILPPRPKYLVVDFTLVTGMDTSALDIFQEIIDTCKTNRCHLFLCGLSPNTMALFRHNGIKPGSGKRVFRLVRDLETALMKAEDGLLKDTMHLLETDVIETVARRRQRSSSDVDDGFVYALQKIDEEHGLNVVNDLLELRSHTRPVEIPTHGFLIQDSSDLGLYFVETGLMRVKANVDGSNMNTMTVSGINGQTHDYHYADPVESIGHLRARGGTIARQASEWKELAVQAHPFQAARIGQGWIIGSIDRISNGRLHYGTHVAITDCRLHHLSQDSIKEIEQSNPTLAMNLYKLISLLSTKRQASTINQLGQFLKIMNNPLPRLRGGKKHLAQLTLQGM